MASTKMSTVKKVSFTSTCKVIACITLKEFVEDSKYQVYTIYDPVDKTLNFAQDIYPWAQDNPQFGARQLLVLDHPVEKVVMSTKS